MNRLNFNGEHIFLPFHYYLIGMILGIWGSLYLIPAIISLCVLIYLLTNENSKKIALIVIGIFLTSYFLCEIHQNFFLFPEKIPVNKYVTVKGQIEKTTTYPEFKSHCVLKNVEISYKGEKIRLKSKILWKIYHSSNPPLPGQNIKGRFKVHLIQTYHNPGSRNYEKKYNLENIFFQQSSYSLLHNVFIDGRPTLLWRFRSFVKGKILKCLKGVENKGLILALIIGDRSYLTYKTTRIFRQASLAHILAQSGLHVGFVALIGIGISLIIGLINSDLYLYIPKQKLSSLISCFFVIFFLCISEPRPSLIRASIMYLSWSILFFFNYKYAIIDGIGVSLLILICLNPYSIFDVGFQLSYISVIVIITFYLVINKKIKNVTSNMMLHYLISILIISAIVSIAIFPLISYYFGEVAIGFYTNVIFVPIIGIIIFPLIFFASIFSFFDVFYQFSNSLFLLCDKILSFCITVISFFYKNGLLPTIVTMRPNSYIILGFYLFLLAIYLKMISFKGKIKFLILVSFTLFFLPFLCNYFHDKQEQCVLKVLDVGRGQSLLVEYKGHRVLIDGGGGWYKSFDFGKIVLSPILTYTRFPELDKVILTMNSIYRMGGLFYLAKKYKINEFYYNGVIDKKINYLLALLRKRNVAITSIKRFRVIPISNYLKLEILKIKEKSDSYLITKLIYKNYPVVTILPKIDKYLIQKYPELPLNSKIVVLPLYALKISTLHWIIRNINPRIAIITGGWYNISKWYLKYKNFFKSHKIRFYSTKISGSVTVLCRENETLYIKVKTFIP